MLRFLIEDSVMSKQIGLSSQFLGLVLPFCLLENSNVGLRQNFTLPGGISAMTASFPPVLFCLTSNMINAKCRVGTII